MSVETLAAPGDAAMRATDRSRGAGRGRALREEILRLLVLEDAASRRRLRDAHALGVDERVEAGGCLAGLELVSDDGARIVLRAPENISRFREGDPATLGGGLNPVAGLAVSIVDEDPVAGVITLERDFLSRGEPLPGGGPFVLDRRDLSTTEKLGRAVASAFDGTAPAGDRLARLLEGPLCSDRSETDRPRLDEAARGGARALGLDASQQEAFARALEADPIHVVQGPPGSGKTRLLAALMAEFVARGERILVTAFTHHAINNVLRAFAPGAEPLPCPVVKIGGAGGGMGRIRVVRQWRGPAPEGPIVVGATAYAAIRMWGTARFDRVVIDEAAQLPLPQGVVALASAGKATVVGDHRQLGPIVQAEPPHPLADVSIFSLLNERHGSTLLTTTYRMNAAINAFVSRHFYGGRLAPALSCASRKLALRPGGRLREILDPDRPALLVLLSHEGYRQRAPAEADLAADLALELLGHHGIPASEIAIVAPYRAQVSAIKQAFRRRAAGNGKGEAPEPVIDTVERIQGQERDVIIASFTGSDPDALARDAAFFFSPNRLNVLLSRARVKRILLASPLAFRAIPRGLDALLQASLFRRLHDESERIAWPPPDEGARP